jgi:non-specific serine/threonine protein kinase
MRLLAGTAVADGEPAASAPAHDWSRVAAGAWLATTLAGIRDPATLAEARPRALRATLRPYQEIGVRWLWFLSRLGLGACLADDMGLGKTIQVLGLLLLLKGEKKRGADRGSAAPGAPSLLVVPASGRQLARGSRSRPTER